MRHIEIEILNSEMIRRQGFPRDFLQGPNRYLKGLVPLHLDVLHPFRHDLFRGRQTRSSSWHRNQLAEGPIGTKMS